MQQKKTLSFQVASEYIPRRLAEALIKELYLKYGLESSPYYDVLDFEYSQYSQHRYALAILLQSFQLKLKPHRELEGWHALSANRLKRLFNDDEFIRVIRADVFFKNNHNYSIKCGTCKGGRLFRGDDELIAQVVSDYQKNPTDSELVNSRGEVFDPKHVGRPQYGKTKPLKVCNIAKNIPIHGDAIRQALSHIRLWIDCGAQLPHPNSEQPRLTDALEAKRTEYKYTKPNDQTAFDSYLSTVCDQLVFLLVFEGMGLPNPLYMSESGRLYRSFLQRCHRVVREVALQGMWCFDFGACHHAIFQHIAKEAGIDCPYLDEYLQDKQAYREALANELGVSVRQVKDALITLAYGAGITHKERYGKPAAIPAILGTEAFLKVKASPKFKGLADELKAISTHLLDSARKKNGYLLNARSLPMRIEGNSKATLIAHLLQGIESQMLNSAIRAHHRGSRPGKEVVVLPLHDGWITRLERDPAAAARAVKKKTGIDIEVDCQQYNLIDL